MSTAACLSCGKKNLEGVEYGYGSPHHYDGVSEWKCPDCGTRVGRWSMKILKEGEREKPYGGE